MRRDVFGVTVVLLCTATLLGGTPAAVLPNPDAGAASTAINRFTNVGPAASSAEPAVFAPKALPEQIVCPPDALYGIGQPAYGQDDPWAVYVSNSQFPGFDPDNQVLLYE